MPTTTEWNNKQDALPSQSGQSGKFLTTNGSTVAWATVQGGGTSDYNDLTNKPTLATVATTGAYNDLTGKPSLATVATSGSYNDLSNKPTIPTVNNPTITFTQGGVTKGNITLNQSSNQTIALDAAPTYSAGEGINISGTTISVDVDTITSYEELTFVYQDNTAATFKFIVRN